MMTMVKKNGFDQSPDQNYGATVFHKQKRKKKKPDDLGLHDDSLHDDQVKKGHADNESKGQQPLVDREVCLKTVLNVTESARARREKRLFTHLGMRGRNW